MGSLGVWEFRSLGVWTIPKVIIPLRSQLSALNSKCAEQPSGNSEDVQSFPGGIVVRAGKATGAVLSRLSHRRHI